MIHWKKWVLIGLVLSVLVSWLFYRSAYLADVAYVYYRNGLAVTLDFKTGHQWEEPIEQYCQREGRAIIWLNEKTESNQKILSAYLTNAEGQTTFQFDTEQLLEQTGMDWIMDIYCTAEEKVVLIAKVITKDTRTHICRLYEFCDGAFQLLYDGYVDGSFSVWGEELLFTALSEASVCESTPQVMALNLQDGSMISLGEGYNASRLNQDTFIWNLGKVCDHKEVVKKDLLTGKETILKPPSFDASINKIRSNGTAIISQNQNYGLIYYYGSVGADGESSMVGLHDFNKNRTINVDRYFRTVLLKKPPKLGWIYPNSHAMNVLLEKS